MPVEEPRTTTAAGHGQGGCLRKAPTHMSCHCEATKTRWLLPPAGRGLAIKVSFEPDGRGVDPDEHDVGDERADHRHHPRAEARWCRRENIFLSDGEPSAAAAPTVGKPRTREDDDAARYDYRAAPCSRSLLANGFEGHAARGYSENQRGPSEQAPWSAPVTHVRLAQLVQQIRAA